MKHKYYIIIVAIALCFTACKKFGTEALSDTTTEKVSLKVKVMNDKDQKLEPGVKVLISRKISANSEFQVVDTVRTDAHGEFTYNLPHPNLFKAEIDTTFYTYDVKELLVQNATSGELILHTKPKFGMATVNVSVLDSVSLVGMGNFLVNVSYRKIGTSKFIDNGSEKTDANGKLLLSLPYPTEIKVKIGNTTEYRPDSVSVNLLDENSVSAQLKVSTATSFLFNATDALDKQYVGNTGFSVYVKKPNETTFTLLKSVTTDASGSFSLSVPHPSQVKVEMLNNKYFANYSVISDVPGYTAIQQKAALMLNAPAFTTPVLTNLQSTQLVLNNGLSLNGPQDITSDGKGNLFISDSGNNRIIKIDDAGNATVLAGSGTAGTVDGAGDVAQFSAPYGIRCGTDGSLYVADDTRHLIRKIVVAADGKATVSTIAGVAGSSGTTDGAGTTAKFNRPAGMALDKANRFLYVAEWGGNKVRKVDLSTNTVTTVAGSGTSSVLGGTGTAATFQIPWGVALTDDETSLYVASWNGSALSKINLSNNFVTVLRKGGTTNFSSPRGIYAAGGKLFVANTGNHTFSVLNNEVETNTTFSLLVGATTSGNAVGSATATRFNGPVGIWYDKYSGKFYVVDTGNNTVKIIRGN
jgi:DNA-binding beta-propeller fold protein YncE